MKTTYIRNFGLGALALAGLLWAETLKPADVKVVGALDYGQTSDEVESTGTPRYSALVFNGNSRDRIDVNVRGGNGKAEVGIADGTLTQLTTATGHLVFTLPDKGPDPEAYYILFRDPDNKSGRFTVELKKLQAQSASLNR